MRVGRGGHCGGRAAALVLALALPAASAFADVTHLTVRFREAATGVDAPQDVARIRQVAGLARTGIGAVSITRDGAYRIALAPALSDDGGRAALAALRTDRDVLYAEPVDGAAAVSTPSRDHPSPRLARIIVKFREGRGAADAANDLPPAAERMARLAALAGRPLAHQRAISWARAHVLHLLAKAPQDEVEAIARALEQDPDVEWAQPDYLRFRNLVPNDPLYASQWHYHAPASAAGGANLPTAWDRTTGWSGVRVAVLDTGILRGHPELASRFIGGYDFIEDWIYANDNDPPQPPACLPTANPLQPPCVSSRDADAADPGDWTSVSDDAGSTFGGWLSGCGVFDSSWHGSHVSGTVGAATNNAAGVAGVNWVSRIVPVRVLGKCGGYDADIADAIEWASGGTVAGVLANTLPARVLNLSLGGGGACPAALQAAITNAIGRNAVVVVSAGNASADASGSAPANCNGVVTVAAVGRAGQRASYSNFGSPTVEIAAPGGSDGDTVLSTVNSGTTVPLPAGMVVAGYQGTSMAAPHVAGIVSLMLSLKPSLTPGDVTTLLQNTARAFPTGTGRDCTSVPGNVGGSVQFCGAGIVNADAALTSLAATGGPGGTALLASTAALSSSPSPSPAGGSVTLTATVTGTPTPTGTVAFTDADVALTGCDTVPLVAGSAQCATASLLPGTHALRAVYSGSATHRPADSAALAHVVNPATPQATATTLASSANPSSAGASVTLTSSVTGIAPTGTLNFRANGTSIAGCAAVALAGSGDTRGGQCTTLALPPGQLAVDVLYSGNATNLASSAALTQGVVAPDACGRFNDILGISVFCASAQWMLNRLVTTGCGIVNYCPDSPVTRLAMAAFLQREGSALTPFDVPLVADFGTLNLASPRVACFDAARNFVVTGHPRRARLRSFANVFGTSTPTAVTVENVYSTNGGVTWTALPTFNAATQTLYTGRPLPEDQTMNLYAELDLDVGTSYLFGLRFAAAPAATSVAYYCSYQTRIFNRNGTSAPF